MTPRHKVVVIGAGFAGIAVVRELRDTYRRSARLIVEACPTAELGHYAGALRD